MSAASAAARGGRQSASPVAPTINLASVDLNLLVALDALLQHCNVTHAASSVGLSQPAMSRILSRLRGMFDDDLLARTSSGYVRTLLGEWLYDNLPGTLNAIRRIVSPNPLEGGDWLTTIRLAMPDHQALLLGKCVAERLSAGNKARELAIEPLNANALKRLESGDLELVVGEIGSVANGFYQRCLYTDSYTCLLRPDHPMLDREWTEGQFLDLQHVVGMSSYEGQVDHVAEALATGMRKSRCTTSPNTMSAAMALLETDMVLTVPMRAATRLAAILGLIIKEVPIAIDPYRVVLFWHERSHRDAEHEWIRSQIAVASNQGPSSAVRH